MNPKMALVKIIEKYWYREVDGRYYYCLPDDKNVRVVKIVDTLLLVHRKVKTNVNPYVEDEYTQARVENRDMLNVTGTGGIIRTGKTIFARLGGRRDTA